jgi:hypothetical protein
MEIGLLFSYKFFNTLFVSSSSVVNPRRALEGLFDTCCRGAVALFSATRLRKLTDDSVARFLFRGRD